MDGLFTDSMRRFEHRCPLSRPFIGKLEVNIWGRCLTRWGKCASPALFEGLRYDMRDLNHCSGKLILTPSRYLPRPLQIGHNLTV